MNTKEFQEALTKFAQDKVITYDDKLGYEYDCALLQVANPDALESFMENIISNIKNVRND